MFSTINQLNVFLICLFFGMVVGIVLFFVSLLTKKLYPPQSKQQILDNFRQKATKLTKKQLFKTIVYHTILCFYVLLACTVFGLVVYLYNYGQLCLFCIIGYAVGITTTFILCKTILKKIIKTIIEKKFKNAK